MYFHPYDQTFPDLFQREKLKIQKAIGNFPVEHVGSTAIPGMAGKGIIDIAIQLENWGQADEVITKLKMIGFCHVHPKENERIFLATEKESKKGDYHIHLALKGSPAYQSLVAFRDFFLSHPEKTAEYSRRKKELWEKSGHDRKKYGRLKGDLIKDLLDLKKIV